MSDVTYPLLAGTAVPTDFVELPSQLYEHWFEEPQVLRRFALHYRTGEPMPEALLDSACLPPAPSTRASRPSNTPRSALVDMDLHQLGSAEDLDVGAFEKAALARIGMPREIVMRHRTPHFSHIFSGDGYSAGYYSYLWSEVLDADAFDAFREAGDIFDRDTARRLHDFIYAAGNRRPPDDAYRAFRGPHAVDPGAFEEARPRRGADRRAGRVIVCAFLQPLGPVAQRDEQLADELARRLVGEVAVGVELVLRLADHHLGPVQRHGVEEDQHLAQMVLRPRRAEEAGARPHDGDGLRLERLVRGPRRPSRWRS